MADLSKVKIAGELYTLKDAGGRTLIATADGKINKEIVDRKAADTGLEKRIESLEARGRYLSTWDASTGLPGDYPTIPSTETGLSYTYTYKAGDYYIINKIPSTGTKYMPKGTSITATRTSATAEWVWSIAKEEYSGTETLVVGGQFLYSTSSWKYVATAKETAWGNIIGNISDQGDLQTALGAKEDKSALKALAYKDNASGSVSTVDSAKFSITPAGTIALGDFTQTSTAASLTKGDFTPAGSVAGTVIPTGTVTLNAFTQTATDITSTGKFTPAGTIAATATGSFTALKSAAFQKSDSGIQIEGTVSKPNVTVDDSSKDTFVKSLKPGDVDAAGMDSTKFSGGSFTGATQASFTQGAKASFTQGSKASFAKGTAISAATEGVTAHMATSEEYTEEIDAETLIFGTAATHNVIGHTEATFTANGDDTFTANGDDRFITNEVGTFTAASVSAGFVTSQKLPVVDGTASAVTGVTAQLAEAPAFTGAKYNLNTDSDTALKEVAFTGTEGNLSVAGQYDRATQNGASFAGNSSGDAITATFTGTKAENVLVTGVNYDKATANGATFTGEAITDKEVTLTKTSKTVTVS